MVVSAKGLIMRNFVFRRPRRLLSTVGSLAIALAGFTASPPAFATDRPVVVSSTGPNSITRRITHADLNLASAAGEATLNRRVGSAVRNLCSETTGGDKLGFVRNTMEHNCRISSWNQARPQIDWAVRRAHAIASTGIAPIEASAPKVMLPK